MTTAKPKGLDSPLTVRFIKLMSSINVRLYLATNGRLGGKWRIGSAFPRGLPVCLLTTTGRKTGQQRISPLLFLEDGDRIVVVASQGGLPKNPAWYWNIKSDPNVTLQIKSKVSSRKARVANTEERSRLWPELVAMYSDFANYQTWTEREIPVVILE